MSAQVVPEWLSNFARGGATTHQHFIGTPANIAALEASGPTKILIHVRHPVATLISGFQLHQHSPDDDVQFFLNRLKVDIDPISLRDKEHGLANFSKLMLPFIIQFMTSWMDYSRRPRHTVDVLFSRYEDETASAGPFGERIVSFFSGGKADVDCAGIMAKLQNEARTHGVHNFQGGVSNQLLHNLDANTRDVINALILQRVLDFYSYESC